MPWNNVVLAEAETDIVLKAIPSLTFAPNHKTTLFPYEDLVVVVANVIVITGDCNELYVLDFMYTGLAFINFGTPHCVCVELWRLDELEII